MAAAAVGLTITVTGAGGNASFAPSYAPSSADGLVTPSAAAGRERVDPKIIAAMVNRFVSDSAEFLQAFGRQAEARLLQLSQRLHRLEQLVRLFEQKVSGLEAAAPRAAPAAAAAQLEEAAAEPVAAAAEQPKQDGEASAAAPAPPSSGPVSMVAALAEAAAKRAARVAEGGKPAASESAAAGDAPAGEAAMQQPDFRAPAPAAGGEELSDNPMLREMQEKARLRALRLAESEKAGGAPPGDAGAQQGPPKGKGKGGKPGKPDGSGLYAAAKAAAPAEPETPAATQAPAAAPVPVAEAGVASGAPGDSGAGGSSPASAPTLSTPEAQPATSEPTAAASKGGPKGGPKGKTKGGGLMMTRSQTMPAAPAGAASVLMQRRSIVASSRPADDSDSGQSDVSDFS